MCVFGWGENKTIAATTPLTTATTMDYHFSRFLYKKGAGKQGGEVKEEEVVVAAVVTASKRSVLCLLVALTPGRSPGVFRGDFTQTELYQDEEEKVEWNEKSPLPSLFGINQTPRAS